MKKNSNKNMTAAELEAAKKAANEKRLETMRRNLSALESEAAAILAKGSEMTAADRVRLLQLVNIAYHDSGKIAGLFSVDSCAACDFCQKMIRAAADNVLMICGSCYAARDAYKEAAWRRHTLNARIFSAVLFSADELRQLAIPGLLCRFNEDGDTVNETMARNYLRIIISHPETRFGYFYKNAAAVAAGLAAEGYTTREQLPDNVRFIHSSYLIGFETSPIWFDDAIFTVYPDDATTAAAIAAGSHPCNGRKCAECGHKCYIMNRRTDVVYIAEKLRCSADSRKVIMEAYKSRRNAAGMPA